MSFHLEQRRLPELRGQQDDTPAQFEWEGLHVGSSSSTDPLSSCGLVLIPKPGSIYLFIEFSFFRHSADIYSPCFEWFRFILADVILATGSFTTGMTHQSV